MKMTNTSHMPTHINDYNLGEDKDLFLENDEPTALDDDIIYLTKIEGTSVKPTTEECRGTDLETYKMYLQEISRIPLLTLKEETEVSAKAAKGSQEAKERLVEANLRLVVRYAKKYKVHGLSLLDLIQEGNIGLMKAVENFDPTRGCRFSTHAAWYIRRNIIRAIENTSRAIRIPTHMNEKLIKVRRVTQHFIQQTGREPNVNELSYATGMSEDAVLAVLDVLKLSTDIGSLDDLITEDGEMSLCDVVADENCVSPESSVERAERNEGTARLLTLLTERERFVIVRRYGFDSGNTHTLEQISREMNLSRERVRQIEGNALRKMRHSSLSRRLQGLEFTA